MGRKQPLQDQQQGCCMALHQQQLLQGSQLRAQGPLRQQQRPQQQHPQRGESTAPHRQRLTLAERFSRKRRQQRQQQMRQQEQQQQQQRQQVGAVQLGVAGAAVCLGGALGVVWWASASVWRWQPRWECFVYVCVREALFDALEAAHAHVVQ